MNHYLTVKGIIEKGHQVASGNALNSPYPYGTIEKQIPIFKELGLDLTNFFRGTINISIHPKTWELMDADFTFPYVKWTDLHPPETFSFSACKILFNNNSYPSWVYYPHPETKKRHFQSPSLIEIIAPPIAEIDNGKSIEIEYNPLQIRVK